MPSRTSRAIGLFLAIAIALALPGAATAAAAADEPNPPPELPIVAIVDSLRTDYPTYTAFSAPRITEDDPHAYALMERYGAGTRVFALTGSVSEGATQNTLGAIVQTASGEVVVAARIPATDDLRITQLAPSGAVVTSFVQPTGADLTAATDCETLYFAQIGILVACGFLSAITGGIGTLVCIPVNVAAVSLNAACTFEPFVGISIQRNPFGGTDCRYTTVSGQFYSRGGRCTLSYIAERSPLAKRPLDEGIRPSYAQSWLRFFDSSTQNGIDVGSNIFETPSFTLRTLVAGKSFGISTGPLETGTSRRPDYARNRLTVGFTDGSYAYLEDVIYVN